MNQRDAYKLISGLAIIAEVIASELLPPPVINITPTLLPKRKPRRIAKPKK